MSNNVIAFVVRSASLLLIGNANLSLLSLSSSVTARDAKAGQQSDPGKGGIFDMTTSLSGMQNMANQQKQEMSLMQIQGESYNGHFPQKHQPSLCFSNSLKYM